MTYSDIKTKFMIEYDKENVTSSYPQLTTYEIATILDKAYLALIGQKVSGNNVRRSTIESDVKSTSDIQPLITNKNISVEDDRQWPEEMAYIKNAEFFDVPSDFLYFMGMRILFHNAEKNETTYSPVKLVGHESAEKFFYTEYNMPWVKIPVCYIENDRMIVLYDPIHTPNKGNDDSVYVTYVKRPKSFVSNVSDLSNVIFECNDSMAEELISLAITFALENVESTRLTSKLNTRGLEA